MSAPIDRLEMIAAVSGPFDPLDLAKGDDLAALGPLALKCEEQLDGGSLRWLLKSDHRRAALAALSSAAEVRQTIAAAPKPAAGDLFTLALRAALLGAGKTSWQRIEQATPAPQFGRLSAAQKSDAAVLSALQFAQHAGYIESSRLKSPLAATRGRLSKRRGQLALLATLPGDLIGREAELSWLIDRATRRRADTRPYYLTGLGGVGKSALVAALLLELQRREAKAVLIDFDAVGMATGEPLPIFLEFVRQWTLLVRARGHEVAADALGNARELLQDTIKKVGTGTKGMSGEEQLSIILTQGLPAMRKVPAAVRREPLLMVFDSFEVVAARQIPATMRLVEVLHEQKVLPGLRLLVSGRELPPPSSTGGATPASPDLQRHLALEGLAERDGARFLAVRDKERKFKSAALRRRASRAVSGHPLALIVLARLASKQDIAEIEAVLGDLENDPAYAAEFAQSFLYTRVLNRISNPQIAQLAHPGLILREVTPGLIRLVLAGPCELGSIDEAAAADLLDQLADQYWLVETLGPRHLRHRPDIRRMMLPGMLAGPRASDLVEVREQKLALRLRSVQAAAAAAVFWRNGPGPDDPAMALFAARSPAERALEASYYAALAGEPPPTDLSPESAATLERGFGPDDFATLPANWRGEIKAAQSNFDRLSHDEVATLGVRSRGLYETDTIDRMRKVGALQQAAEMARSEQHRAREHRTLEAVQILLRDAGYYRVSIDGVLGPAMRRALGELGISVLPAAKRKADWSNMLLTNVKRKLRARDGERKAAAEREADARDLETAAAPTPTAPAVGALTADLAESRANADFEAGEFDPGPIEVLIEHLLADTLPSLVRGEIEKGRLWNTGLWKGSLAAAAAGAITAQRFDWASGLGRSPPLDGAIALVSNLFASGSTPLVDPQLLLRMVSSSGGRLEGIDGARLMLLLARLLGHYKAGPTVNFDATGLALLAPDGLIAFGSNGSNSDWIGDNGLSENGAPRALVNEGPGFSQFDRLRQSRNPGLGEFEVVWATRFMIRTDLAQLAQAPAGALRALRPLAPELVLSATRLLAAHEGSLAAGLINRLANDALCWPHELWFADENLPPNHAKSARKFDAELSFTVVQTLDRVGMLGALLEALARGTPPTSPAARLHGFHTHLTTCFALWAPSFQQGDVQ